MNLSNAWDLASLEKIGVQRILYHILRTFSHEDLCGGLFARSCWAAGKRDTSTSGKSDVATAFGPVSVNA